VTGEGSCSNIHTFMQFVDESLSSNMNSAARIGLAKFRGKIECMGRSLGSAKEGRGGLQVGTSCM
jgi:hypothetical protein